MEVFGVSIDWSVKPLVESGRVVRGLSGAWYPVPWSWVR